MKTRKRIPATLLAIATAFSLVGYVPAYAAEHIHDETCGYSEGSPCTHTIHDETCGYAEAANLPCKHELGQHDETCGYVAATPCTNQASPAELGTLTASGANVEELISTATCTVSSEVANTEQDVITWLKDTWLPGIDGLADTLQSEFYIEINALTVVTDTSSSSPPPFVKAQDGTSESPNGEAGHYSFIICMGSGSSVTTLGRNTCIITAKAYTPPLPVREAPVITASGVVAGTVTAVRGSTVTLTASLPPNVEEHRLIWKKNSPGDTGFTSIADAAGTDLEITIDDHFVDHTQYRCDARYLDGTIYQSNVLTIQAEAEEEAAYTVSINEDEDEGEGFLLKADRTSVKLVAVIKDAVTGAPFTDGDTTKYAWTLTGTDSAYFSADATNQVNMTVTVKDGTKGTHNVTVGLTVTIGGIEIPASSIVITRQEADKSGLQSKMDEALSLYNNTIDIDDGDSSNVEVGKYWILTEFKNDFAWEMNAAKDILSKWNASESEVMTAEGDLQDAITIFKINRIPGTKSTSNNNNSSDTTGNRNDSDKDSSSKENKDNTAIKVKPSKEFTAIKVKDNKITITTGKPSFVLSKGIAKSTIKPDISELQKAIKNATPENPHRMSIAIPSDNAAKQLKKSKVKTVELEIRLPKKVLDNKNKKTVILEQITLDKTVLKAAQETGKNIKIAVQDEKGNESYAITAYGKNIKDQNLSGTQMNFAADITADENKTVVELKQDGNIPVGKVKVEVSGNLLKGLTEKEASPQEASPDVKVEVGDEAINKANKALEDAAKKEWEDAVKDAVEKVKKKSEDAAKGSAKSVEEEEQAALHVYKATDIKDIYQDLGAAKLEYDSNKIIFWTDQGGKYGVLPNKEVTWQENVVESLEYASENKLDSLAPHAHIIKLGVGFRF